VIGIAMQSIESVGIASSRKQFSILFDRRGRNTIQVDMDIARMMSMESALQSPTYRIAYMSMAERKHAIYRTPILRADVDFIYPVFIE
jgi:hypothetical protein